MSNIFITGPTGNIGTEVLAALHTSNHKSKLFVGVRDTAFKHKKLSCYDLHYVRFDFTNTGTFAAAFQNIDLLFLLRPPQISDVSRYFAPLVESAKQAAVKHIVFLSVQGVENSKIIPHHKIEKLLVASEIPYTFLRPAYFMQNFTTMLSDDIVHKKQIYLPAGNASFTLIDTSDIGRVAAAILMSPMQYRFKTFDLTTNEARNFKEMACKLSKGLGKK